MGKIWLIVLLSFSSSWWNSPSGSVEVEENFLDTGAGFFPFDSASLTRQGYQKPDSLRKYGPLADKDFKKNCEALREFLAYEEQSLAYQYASRIQGLPPDARIMEAVLLATKGYPDRMLVLWMHSPWVYLKCDSKYKCPEYTTGSHYIGRTRVSLVNTRTNHVINTIPVKFPDNRKFPMHAGLGSTRTDYFYVPFYIGHPSMNPENHLFRYETSSVIVKDKENKFGRAVIMNLSDFNGDGRDLEFVAFNQVSCNTCMTALYGYSPRRDKVMQYPFILDKVDRSQGDSLKSIYINRWMDNLFVNKPIEKAHWRYSNNYLMEASYVEYYDVYYNDTTETFQGLLELRSR